MRKLLLVLAVLACSAVAFAQTNIGEVSISQLGTENNVDAVCTGTVTANAGSGTFIVGDGAGALNTIVDSGSLTCNAGSGTFVVGDGAGALNVIVDSSALPSGAATAALQDGIIKDGAGDTTQANVSSGRLSVDAGTVTVTDGAGALNVIVDSGSVTANAGTNLNTSALALEAGGNLAGAATSLAILDDWDNGASDGVSVSGDVANDAADAGEPVKIGGKAFSWGTGQTAVAVNERVNAVFSRDGVQFVQSGAPHSTSVEYLWTTAQTNDPLVTVSSGTRVVVTGYQIQISSPTVVATTVRCGFGTSTLTTAPTDGNTAVSTFVSIDVVPGSGANSPPGFLVAGEDDEDVRCTTSAPTTGTGRMFLFYYVTSQ